jgi:Cys-rich protein (TIGR01571 family)
MSAPPAAAPATNGANNSGPINDRDMEDWKNRFNDVFAKPSEHINAPEIEGSQDWQNSFFGCCNPIDTCLITYCLPCVTFGKTHHRTRKNANMEGYEPINTSCLLFFASMWVGLHAIPLAMQRADIRQKYHLKGTCLTDLALGCCCGLCSMFFVSNLFYLVNANTSLALVQDDKEAEYREAQGGSQQYKQDGGMTYAPQA